MSRMLPILFNTEMVKAILDDRKYVTRRVIKPQPEHEWSFWKLGDAKWNDRVKVVQPMPWHSLYNCLRYHPDDILYVRETWCKTDCFGLQNGYLYKAMDSKQLDALTECTGFVPKWRPSIHMPKEAARIFLRVTDVWLERLGDMTLNDFLDEGIVIRPEAFNDPENAYQQAKKSFSNLWNSTISKKDIDKYGYYADPWIVAYRFERCKKPK